ncbi:BON domain-containing protein [Povalibacter sp.]|uniref:BON domain-containing protein n=1 Tax=Povalibacter sp. TaxID=1962978 RepID=UPI002F42D97A
MRKFPTLVLGLGLAAVSSGAIADNAAGKSDASLAGSVKSALISNDATKARQINVETHGGVVQLNGFVDSAAAKAAAETTAKNVAGVTKVENQLSIRDPNRSTGEVVDDTVIAAKVKGEIAGKAGLGTASDVNVEVNAGIVELSGFVATTAEKTHAAEVAGGISGVKEVRNNISVKPAG